MRQAERSCPIPGECRAGSRRGARAAEAAGHCAAEPLHVRMLECPRSSPLRADGWQRLDLVRVRGVQRVSAVTWAASTAAKSDARIAMLNTRPAAGQRLRKPIHAKSAAASCMTAARKSSAARRASTCVTRPLARAKRSGATGADVIWELADEVSLPATRIRYSLRIPDGFRMTHFFTLKPLF